MLANGVTELADPRLGVMGVPGVPIHLSETPARLAAAPELGQHTEEILQEIGCAWDEIGRLRESRTIL